MSIEKTVRNGEEKGHRSVREIWQRLPSLMNKVGEHGSKS